MCESELVDWQAIFDSYVKDQQKINEIPAENEFRASSLGCLRQCTKSRLGLSKFDDEGLRTLQIGTNLHRFIQQELAVGYLPKPMQFEKKVSFEFAGIKFTGHIDCWDGEIIYDFKSTSNVEWSIKYPTLKAYIMQLSLYAYALKAKKAVLVYVDKRNYKIEMKEIELMDIGEIVKFCYDVMAACRQYHMDGSLPGKCSECYVCKIKEKDD